MELPGYRGRLKGLQGSGTTLALAGSGARGLPVQLATEPQLEHARSLSASGRGGASSWWSQCSGLGLKVQEPQLPAGPPGSTERRPGAGPAADDSGPGPGPGPAGSLRLRLLSHWHGGVAAPGRGYCHTIMNASESLGSRSRCPPSPAPARGRRGRRLAGGDGSAARGGGQDPRIPLAAPGPGGPAASGPLIVPH